MDIRDMNPEQLVDLFDMSSGNTNNQVTETPPVTTFQMSENNVDLMNTGNVKEETPKVIVDEKIEPVKDGEIKEVDLLVDEKKIEDKNESLSDISAYYEERLKAGKFVAIEEEVDGEKRTFIPKTLEEFDEVLELQVNYKVEEAKKGLDQNWYQEKSPAWQAVAKYAELVDDPTEIVPFLQGIQNIQSIAGINEKEIEGAEQILRFNLQQRGIDAELIDTQIESLKTTDKLIATAEKVKPQMVQQEQVRLAQMQQEQQQRLQNYYNMVSDIRENAIKAIEAPIYGSAKLTREEKAIVYDLIAEPDNESKGYRIYNKIDELFEKKDFDTLKQIALLLEKKESFLTYVGAKAAQETSSKLQRQLRVATDSRTSSSGSTEEPTTPTVQRNQYNKGTVRFGRG